MVVYYINNINISIKIILEIVEKYAKINEDNNDNYYLRSASSK